MHCRLRKLWEIRANDLCLKGLKVTILPLIFDLYSSSGIKIYGIFGYKEFQETCSR